MTIFSVRDDFFRGRGPLSDCSSYGNIGKFVACVCGTKIAEPIYRFNAFASCPVGVPGVEGGVWEAAPGASALIKVLQTPAAAIQVNVEGGELTGVHR